jgi:phenylpyruvate tautomerase PptA (4-oxalocrotonate tautomerase family)
MPVYTCTTARSALDAPTKALLATELASIHSRINDVPSRYVNVVFHSLPEEDLYTDGRPAAPLIIDGWTRTGHPEDRRRQLVLEIADAATRVTGIPAERVLVVIGDSPARFAVEAGRVLPEPGDEDAWLRDDVG